MRIMRCHIRRLVMPVLVCAIIFISIRILTSMRRVSFSEMENWEMAKLNIKHHVAGKHSFKTHSHNKSTEINKDDIVSELVNKYSLNFKYPIMESPWTIARKWVSQDYVHPEFTPELGKILHSMWTRKIVAADVGYKGTQLKMSLVLEGGQKAAFKPKWFHRDHVIQGKPYDGEDRHNGEIAAFHLGRLLEFRLTPLAVGRVVDLETEILPVGKTRLTETFFQKGNNTCFYGKCFYCKGKDMGVCAEGNLLEGTVILWLPDDKVHLKTLRHPWARTYKDGKQAEWEHNTDYCRDKILPLSLYNHGPRLLDLIDAMVLDYLIGNADRHHYETNGDKETSRVMLLDNAKSFGNPFYDEPSILAPLRQCCRIREKTWLRLQVLQEGVLSRVLSEILSQDPVAPIITQRHLEAIDRRLIHIISAVNLCLAKNGPNFVLIKYT